MELIESSPPPLRKTRTRDHLPWADGVGRPAEDGDEAATHKGGCPPAGDGPVGDGAGTRRSTHGLRSFCERAPQWWGWGGLGRAGNKAEDGRRGNFADCVVGNGGPEAVESSNHPR